MSRFTYKAFDPSMTKKSEVRPSGALIYKGKRFVPTGRQLEGKSSNPIQPIYRSEDAR